jgi:hypothetical protein
MTAAWPTTYAGWVAKIKDRLDVIDLSDDQLGQFLFEGNDRLNRELNSQWMEKTITGVLVDANGQIDLSTVDGYNRMRLVNVVNGPSAKALNVDEFINKIAVSSGIQANALYYCVDSMKLLFWPALAEGTAVDIRFYEMIPYIVSGVLESNVFTTKHPDAFLYAAILAATPYVVEDERLATWNEVYTNIVEGINKRANDARKGSTPLIREINVYG